MGEQVWCSVHVHVPATWNTTRTVTERNIDSGPPRIQFDETIPPWFIVALGEALYNGESPDHSPESGVWSINGEGNYGSLDSDVVPILDFMRTFRIPFTFAEEGGGEWSGTIEVFDGTRSVTETWDPNLGVTLSEGDWKAMLDTCDDPPSMNQCIWLVNAVIGHFTSANRDAGDLPIDHLPAECSPPVECTGTYTYGGMFDHTEPCPLHPDAEIKAQQLTHPWGPV